MKDEQVISVGTRCNECDKPIALWDPTPPGEFLIRVGYLPCGECFPGVDPKDWRKYCVQR
ncbi:MAG TPA: hypothetical protein VFX97_16730 [Pyrinomonadaceae bacterium]|nr:hypothetical protein [Pyrinomonadaceae bacterium]